MCRHFLTILGRSLLFSENRHPFFSSSLPSLLSFPPFSGRLFVGKPVANPCNGTGIATSSPPTTKDPSKDRVLILRTPSTQQTLLVSGPSPCYK